MASRKNLTLAAALVMLCAVALSGCNDHSSPEYNVVNEAVPSDALTYAGSTVCQTCHKAIYESWEKTRHTKKVRAATLATIVNDADNNGVNDFIQGGAGIAFDVMSSVPAGQTTWDDYTLGPDVEFPKLGWDGSNLLLRIGPNTYNVTFVLGGTGKWKQRYMVTIGNGEYISPVQFNDVTREYVPYHLGNWYTMSGTTLTGYIYNGAAQTPVTQGRTRDSWQRRCVGCHTTGLRDISRSASGEYGDNITDMLAKGTLGELPVACEACHGPAKRHVELGGGVGTALNPVDLASDRADESCGYCHGRGSSTNSEGFGYPWAPGSLVDNGYKPGEVLGDYYVNNGGLWDDGATHSSSHHQQWLDHKDSPHAKAGVTCFQCHDPHGSGIEGDLRMEPLQLCLSCHDGQGNIDSDNLALHTRHTEAEAQSCNNCHFNLVAKSGIKYDVHSHTYRVIYPVETETSSGIPNSCAKCHKDESIAELTSYLRTRFADVKPVAYASAGASGFGSGFTLDGSRSFDPLGGRLDYEWTFKAGPPSFSADQLLASTGEEALFIPSQPGKHTFMLVVTNEKGIRSNPTEVDVDVTAGVIQNLPDLTKADYVKSFACSFCHQGIHDGWQVTRHTQKVRRPNEGYGVVFADTNNNGTNDWLEPNFNLRTDPAQGQTSWDDLDQAYASGVTAPILNHDAESDTYSVTIGNITYPVTWLLGGTGKWKQRYMVTIDEGEYILPIQYNEVTNEWVQYHPQDWYNIDGDSFEDYVYNIGEDEQPETPITEGLTNNSWQRRCTACHVTGARDMTQNPTTKEYALSIETMLAAESGPRIAETGIGCEACHGPGSVHVSTPALRGSIVNPSKLSALRANEACGACHNRGDSATKEFGFPWGPTAVDGHYIPGMDLSDFYTPKDELSGSFFPDPYGHAKQHHEQWLDLRWSKHFTEAGMDCSVCHTGHNENFVGQLKQEETSLCKTCHPDVVTGQGRDANHSRHPDGLLKCSNCHNPLVAKSAIPADISAHSFQLIWPKASLDTGITNSCNTRGCHSNSIDGMREWDYSDWNEDDPADALADYSEQQMKLNNLFGDLRPYAEARVIDPEDGKPKRAVAAFSGTKPITVTLDGTKSYDPNGGVIRTYAWAILSAPALNRAKLSNRLSPTPTIDLTEVGTYVFTLTVIDAEQSSEPQTVTIEVK